jgi:ferredoxin
MKYLKTIAGECIACDASVKECPTGALKIEVKED